MLRSDGGGTSDIQLLAVARGNGIGGFAYLDFRIRATDLCRINHAGRQVLVK